MVLDRGWSRRCAFALGKQFGRTPAARARLLAALGYNRASIRADDQRGSGGPLPGSAALPGLARACPHDHRNS
jgi:hypothetical protein